jgi:hypothetical protein
MPRPRPECAYPNDSIMRRSAVRGDRGQVHGRRGPYRDERSVRGGCAPSTITMAAKVGVGQDQQVSDIAFDGAKVFSATMGRDRVHLGERITSWISEHPEVVIVDKAITQSSDAEYHCLAITLFWRTAPTSLVS